MILFSNFTSIPFDMLSVSWVTNYAHKMQDFLFLFIVLVLLVKLLWQYQNCHCNISILVFLNFKIWKSFGNFFVTQTMRLFHDFVYHSKCNFQM